MRGREAARLFYDTDRFQRSGAAPRRMERTLFGEGGVQGLDDADHRHRKQLFLQLMTPERIGALVGLVEQDWRARADAWGGTDGIVLRHELARILARTVHAWAEVPLAAARLDQRVADLHGMIVGGGGIGPNYLRGRRGRVRAERQLARVVDAVRTGRLRPAPASALGAVAHHRERDGRPLDRRVAAVELLNVLRPTVAVDRYIALTALALHQHPGWRERLRDGDDALHERFVHEVRRRYPFFPFAAARARTDVEWRDHRIPRGRRVLLDLYGTGHDPDVFDEPTRFRPERFEDRTIGPFELVPQGGGDHLLGHRCAGEWLTIELMKAGVRLLTRAMSYTVPHQDLRIARGKIPALPASGFVITDVRRAE